MYSQFPLMWKPRIALLLLLLLTYPEIELILFILFHFSQIHIVNKTSILNLFSQSLHEYSSVRRLEIFHLEKGL